MKGAQSDTVEKFFATTESAVLFPEYVARVVQRGMEESDIVPMITASVTRVDDEEQVGKPSAADMRLDVLCICSRRYHYERSCVPGHNHYKSNYLSLCVCLEHFGGE